MFQDSSYKVSFISAVILHLVLLLFLLIKFSVNSTKIAGHSSYNFINATVVNQGEFKPKLDSNNRSINKPIANNQPQPLTPKETIQNQPVASQTTINQTLSPKPQKIAAVKKPLLKKEELAKILQQNLLKEQAKELMELKSQKQKHNKKLAKQKEQALQKMMQEELLAEKEELAGSRAGAYGNQLQGEVDKYKSLMVQAIASHWIVPEGVDIGATCKLLINLAPGGVVLNVELTKSSGNLALDRSAQAAVLKASPLPVPEEHELFDKVRTINLTVRPEGVVGN